MTRAFVNRVGVVLLCLVVLIENTLYQSTLLNISSFGFLTELEGHVFLYSAKQDISEGNISLRSSSVHKPLVNFKLR